LTTKCKAQANERQERDGRLTKGDVAILRFLVTRHRHKPYAAR
jgi:hypothetical protein